MERPFTHPGHEPDEDELEAVLEPAMFGRWWSLLAIAEGFTREWTFAGKSGWMLKVGDARKALVWLVPLRRGFRASLAIRESEREPLLVDEALAPLHEQIRSARKLPEGYAVAFEVHDGAEADLAAGLLRTIVAARK
jgi:hypothetical protein